MCDKNKNHLGTMWDMHINICIRSFALGNAFSVVFLIKNKIKKNFGSICAVYYVLGVKTGSTYLSVYKNCVNLICEWTYQLPK